MLEWAGEQRQVAQEREHGSGCRTSQWVVHGAESIGRNKPSGGEDLVLPIGQVRRNITPLSLVWVSNGSFFSGNQSLFRRPDIFVPQMEGPGTSALRSSAACSLSCHRAAIGLGTPSASSQSSVPGRFACSWPSGNRFGIRHTARVLQCSPQFVFYHSQKAAHPLLHPRTHGGVRRQRFPSLVRSFIEQRL